MARDGLIGGPMELTEEFLQAATPVFLIDPERKQIVDVNGAACELLGFTRYQMRGHSLTLIHPAEFNQLSRWLEEIKAEGRSWSRLFTCRTIDGTTIPTEMQAFLVEGSQYVLVLVRERSGHRASPDSA